VLIVADKKLSEVEAFAHLITASMEQDAPDRYTTNIKRAARKGNVRNWHRRDLPCMPTNVRLFGMT
jgi:DNA primase